MFNKRRTGPKSAKNVKRRQTLTPRRATVTSIVTRQPRGFNSGFPPLLKIRHKYCESEVALSSTTGAVSTYQFSCNGMFDPNITGSGHQPLYFDQLTAIYDHYTVLRSFIRIRITAGTNAVPYIIGLYVDDDTSTALSPDEAFEQNTASFVPVNGGDTTPNITLVKAWDASKYFGPNPLANDNLQGTSAANPTEQSYFTVKFKGQGVGTISATMSAEIWYEAVWDELKTVGSS